MSRCVNQRREFPTDPPAGASVLWQEQAHWRNSRETKAQGPPTSRVGDLTADHTEPQLRLRSVLGGLDKDHSAAMGRGKLRGQRVKWGGCALHCKGESGAGSAQTGHGVCSGSHVSFEGNRKV